MSVKMRTLPQAAAELKAADPETAISVSTLRLLVKRGEIPVVKIRNRQLVSMDTLFAFLAGGSSSAPEQKEKAPAEELGAIRRLDA